MWGLPLNASSHGHEIDTLILLVHIMMAVLFLGWAVFFIFVLFRFRRSANPKANYKGVQSHISSTVEVAVVIAEAVLLIGFSIPFWVKQVNALPNRPNLVEVRVVAEQFAWNIHYPGEDGIFGKTRPDLIDTQSNPVGLDREDPNAKDDITTINELNLPVGRTAYIHLTSKDVMHSFALPVMRVKQDVIPGMSIPVWFTPTRTGNFEIACAQLCGLGHYRMRGFLNIQTEDEFKDWLASQAIPQGEDAEGYDDFWN